MKILKDYLLLTVALLVSAIGWSCFIIPAKIVGSGLVGLSTLINLMTDLPVGPVNFLANMVLILIALKVVGLNFGFKTIYCLVMLSFFIELFGSMIDGPIVPDNRFMCAIIGSMIVGLTIGFMLSIGGSTGGTEIIAMMFTKYWNVRPGHVMMGCDVFIIAASFLVHHSIEDICYGYVVMLGISITVDYVLMGQKQSVQIMIISKKGNELATFIQENVARGITLIPAIGFYTGESRNIIMMLCRKDEMSQVLRATQYFDPEAFISVGSVMAVYGSGFDAYKPSFRKRKLVSEGGVKLNNEGDHIIIN